MNIHIKRKYIRVAYIILLWVINNDRTWKRLGTQYLKYQQSQAEAEDLKGSWRATSVNTGSLKNWGSAGRWWCTMTPPARQQWYSFINSSDNKSANISWKRGGRSLNLHVRFRPGSLLTLNSMWSRGVLEYIRGGGLAWSRTSFCSFGEVMLERDDLGSPTPV